MWSWFFYGPMLLFGLVFQIGVVWCALAGWALRGHGVSRSVAAGFTGMTVLGLNIPYLALALDVVLGTR